jgi:hypothetical protein
MTQRWISLLAPLVLAVLAFSPRAVSGEEDERTPEEENLEVSSPWREYFKEHFEIHGYLSTAYVSVRNRDGEDQPRSTDQYLQGLMEGETFDYRIAALQVRYEPAPRHSFLLQLAHRSLADSSITALEKDLVLDWLFYRFQVRENLELSLGRFPVANGLFNKFRDVGVLLPFFRPSYNFYRDGDFISETVDGLGMTYRHRWTSGWRLEVEGYAGRHDLLEGGGAIPRALVEEIRVEPNMGVQLWLRPPIAGLQLAVGGQRFDLAAGSNFNDGPATWKNWFASVEYLGNKLTLRGEFRSIAFPIDTSPVFDNDAGIDFSYLQLGYQWTRRLGLWGQVEWGRAHQVGAVFPDSRIAFRSRDDVAFSTVFALNEHLVWKAEFHWEAFDIGATQVISTDPLRIDPQLTGYRSRFTIVSFSTSF